MSKRTAMKTITVTLDVDAARGLLEVYGMGIDPQLDAIDDTPDADPDDRALWQKELEDAQRAEQIILLELAKSNTDHPDYCDGGPQTPLPPITDEERRAKAYPRLVEALRYFAEQSRYGCELNRASDLLRELGEAE